MEEEEKKGLDRAGQGKATRGKARQGKKKKGFAIGYQVGSGWVDGGLKMVYRSLERTGSSASRVRMEDPRPVQSSLGPLIFV